MPRVVLLLTGPFGLGAMTAGRLAALVDGVMVDPQLLGADARVADGVSSGVDYQHLPLWRRAVIATVREPCQHGRPHHSAGVVTVAGVAASHSRVVDVMAVRHAPSRARVVSSATRSALTAAPARLP